MEELWQLGSEWDPQRICASRLWREAVRWTLPRTPCETDPAPTVTQQTHKKSKYSGVRKGQVQQPIIIILFFRNRLSTFTCQSQKTLVLVSGRGSCRGVSSGSEGHTYLCVEAVIRQTAGGEEEDGWEGGDVLQEAEECGLECRAHCVPPALHVWDVQDARSRSLSLAEQLDEDKFIYFFLNT